MDNIMKSMSLICLDTETTGLDFNADDVVEFSSVIPLEDDVKTLDLYLPTERDIDPTAVAKNGFSKKILKKRSGGRSREEILKDILNFIDGFVDDTLFIAMNMPFDLTMLLNNFSRTFDDGESMGKIDHIKENIRCFDTYVIDKVLRPRTEGQNRKLETLAEVYDTMTKPSHNSLDDAKCTLEIALRQFDMLAQQDIIPLDDMDEIHAYVSKRNEDQRRSLNDFFLKVGHEPVEYFDFPYYDTE